MRVMAKTYNFYLLFSFIMEIVHKRYNKRIGSEISYLASVDEATVLTLPRVQSRVVDGSDPRKLTSPS